MKIAISSTGKDLESQVGMVFGRCKYFIIVDVEEKEIKNYEALENTASTQFGGAGIAAAELVGNQGVKIVITGALGPRAFGIFNQIGIKAYKGTGTIKKAVEDYLEGKLQEITAPGPMQTPPGMGRGAGMGRRQI
ncbi:MAG: NifB/NifX family molybdenum-iron cluster-binding protein [Candidatus Aenigmarchaeota archaeon]|nr:NifB/NifX family molybdenum-iron cluster-binding protein [Candidatus Aenigmarchaeota archaeon]